MQTVDFVRVSYSGKIKETGVEFDKGDNVPVILKEGYIIKGLEEELKGMEVGKKKKIEIPPKKGFGERKPKLVRLIPLSEFRKREMKPEPGKFIRIGNNRGKVLSVSGGRVRVDFNHPLAGKTLIYDIEINEKIEKPEEKIKAMVESYTRMDKNKINVKINESEVEIETPPMVLNSLFKKKIADDVRKFLSLETTKFVEIFEKPKEK